MLEFFIHTLPCIFMAGAIMLAWVLKCDKDEKEKTAMFWMDKGHEMEKDLKWWSDLHNDLVRNFVLTQKDINTYMSILETHKQRKSK